MFKTATTLLGLVILLGCGSEQTIEDRRERKDTSSARPQEPGEPCPYASEEVTYRNGIDDGVVAGTLTTPLSGSLFPAVLLLSASGP